MQTLSVKLEIIGRENNNDDDDDDDDDDDKKGSLSDHICS
jgi:hypothetical protein